MAPLARVVAAALALCGLVSAKTLEDLAPNSKNLIPIHQDQEPGAIGVRRQPNIFQAIRPKAECDLRAGFNLRQQHAIFWGGKGGAVAALHVRTAENERILDSEHFDNLVESMDCPGENQDSGEITLRFQDQGYFAAAAVWDWVNELPGNQVLFIVGPGKCGWNQDRIVYQVGTVEVNDEDSMIVLHAKSTTWKNTLHSFDFKMNKDAARAEAAGLLARDDDSDLTIPVDVDMSGKGVQFDIGDMSFVGLCSECSNSGSFDVDIDFSVDWFKLEKASVTLSTGGMTTKGIFQVQAKGALSTSYKYTKPIINVPLSGTSIPGILDFGPTFEVAFQVALQPIKTGVIMTFGGTSTLEPSSSTIDFLSEEGTVGEGWGVTLEPEPFSVETMVEAEVDVSIVPSIGLDFSVLGKYARY